jgi:secreted trypsin-like serine protease
MYLAQTITLFLLTIVLQCSGQAGRIIGGEPVGSDRFPYFTIVRTRRDKGGIRNVTTECGGSLITSDVVLVGAVCMEMLLVVWITKVSLLFSDRSPLLQL